MKLIRLTRSAAALLTALMLSLGAGIYLNSQSTRSLEDSYEQQKTYISLGQQLANASDYLTRQTRLFAVTGDQKHLENYWTEVNETQRRKQAVEEFKESGASSEEQSTTSEELARSVQSISTAARESAAGVTQVSDAAQNLDGLTAQLQDNVRQFRLSEEESSHRER